MSIPDWLGLPVLDLAAGTLTVSLWVAGAAAALLVLFLALAIVRAGLVRVIGTVVGVLLVALVLGAAAMLINRADRADERRALDQRLNELTVGVIAPGSILACLDVGIGEAVEGACEKAVFASPEAAAAATAFVSAR